MVVVVHGDRNSGMFFGLGWNSGFGFFFGFGWVFFLGVLVFPYFLGLGTLHGGARHVNYSCAERSNPDS